MADPARYPDGGDPDHGPGPDAAAPRWKSVLGVLIAGAVVALIVYLHLAGIVGPGAH